MINKIILGTVQFGLEYGINNTLGKPSKAEVFEILSLAKESGITTLDTADHYGNSPELIGEFKRNSGKQFLINTKFKVDSKSSIPTQLQSSLQRLESDTAEVYFYHSFAEFIQYPQVKVELTKLKQASKLHKIGVSVYTNDEIEVAIKSPEVDVIQLPFNLLDNESLRGTYLRKAKEAGKIIQVRSLFLQGLFFKNPDEFPRYLDPLKKYVVQLQSIAEESNLAMEHMCLAYALSQPAIDQVIIGVDNKVQLKKNLGYATDKMDNEIVKTIDALAVSEKELLHPINWK